MNTNSWVTGISVVLTGVQDNITENAPGSHHRSLLEFEIQPKMSSGYPVWDAIYNESFQRKYPLPLVNVSIFDPIPSSIAPPQLLEARFDEALTKIHLTFDSPTSGIGKVPCEEVLKLSPEEDNSIFGESEGRICSWISKSKFEIALGYDASIRIGSYVHLKNGAVFGECKMLSQDGKSCLNKRYACEDCFVPLQLPLVLNRNGEPTGELFSLEPKVVASYNAKLGLCDDLNVDVSASTGSGPFQWDAFSVETLSCKGAGNTCTEISNPSTNASIDLYRMQVIITRNSFDSSRDWRYTFRISLINIIGEMALTDIYVESVANALPTFIIAGPAFRTVRRGRNLKLSVSKLELPCNGATGNLNIVWTDLVGFPSKTNIRPEQQHSVAINIVDPTNFNIKSDGLLSGYTYNITGTASLDGSPTIRAEASVQIEVIYSPLIAIILPPGRRSVGMNETIVLDGTKSFDPDDSGQLIYIWRCEDCPEIVQSQLRQKSANIIMNYTGESRIFLSAGQLLVNSQYTIGLSIGSVGIENVNRNMSEFVETILTVEPGDPPDINLVGPKKDLSNPNEPLVVEAKFKSCCFGSNFECLNFSVVWNANISIKTNLEDLREIYDINPQMFLSDPHKMTDSDVSTGSRTYKVILAAGSLLPGSEYHFSFTVRDACGFATASLPIIRMNAPPTGGSIRVSPKSGFAIGDQETTFSMSAMGWTDPEARPGLYSPLEYKFVYLEDPTDMKSRRVQIKTQTDVISYKTVLNHGVGMYGTMLVGVIVTDFSGASTESSFFEINVTSAPLPISTQAQEEIFDKMISNSIEIFENKSQNQEVLARANMIGKSLSSADESVKEKITAKLVDVAFEASSKMSNDGSAIELQAQFLNTVKDNTMDDTTIDKMLTVTESLTASSEVIGSISPSTTNALVSTLSTFIQKSKGESPSTSNENGQASINEASKSNVNVRKVQRMYTVVTSVISAVATSMISGSESVTLDTPSFAATVGSASPSALVSEPINVSGGVSIALSYGVIKNLSSAESIHSLALNFNDAPSFDNGSTKLASDNVRIVLKSGGIELNVSNLESPIELTLPLAENISLGVNVSDNSQVAMPYADIFCTFVGQNITISNCSDPLTASDGVYPKSFSLTCTPSMMLGGINGQNPPRIECPRLYLEPKCVYWNETSNSWQDDGLNTVIGNSTGDIICQSSHLTDFSVKLLSSLQAVDDILESPFTTEIDNAEELFALLSKNAIVIITMFILICTFLASCFASHHMDSLENFESRQKNAINVRNIWSASRGIISWRQLQMNVRTSHCCNLWVEGNKAYHPILSIWYTHTLAINRPQRVMTATVMITANMFISAMFWRARYPNADSTPSFEDTILFGMVAAAMNYPIIKLSEELYKRVGAATVLKQKYMLLGKYVLKGDSEEAERRLREDVTSVPDALAHIQMVRGAVAYIKSEIEKLETRVALSRRGSTMKKMQNMELLERQKELYKMNDQLTASRQMLNDMKKEARSKLQESMTNFNNENLRNRWLIFQRCKARIVEAEMAERLRLSEMNAEERDLDLVLKEKNFLIRMLFEVNSDQRDPKLHKAYPLPWWSGHVLDFFSFSLVVFFCYFIVAFGMFYGSDVAWAWLQSFLLSMFLDFLGLTPVIILLRVVVLPRLVLLTVFNEPRIAHLGSTPLMSGTKDGIHPTSRVAFAMGFSSVATVGFTGAKARRWLDKTREKNRLRWRNASLNYVWDENGGVKAMYLRKGDKKISRYIVAPEKQSNSSGMAHGDASELHQVHERYMVRKQKKYIVVNSQNLVAARQVEEELINRETLDLVLTLFSQNFLEANQKITSKASNEGFLFNADRNKNVIFSNFRINDESMMELIMEFVMEDVLQDLKPKSSKRIISTEDIASTAANTSYFLSNMAINRIEKNRTEAARKLANNYVESQKREKQKLRVVTREKRAAAVVAGTSELPKEKIPSNIISRARKRLNTYLEPEEDSVAGRILKSSPLAKSLTIGERNDLLKQARLDKIIPAEMKGKNIEKQAISSLKSAEEKNRASMLAAVMLNTE